MTTLATPDIRPTPIIPDCDPGHDDAIALVMAHRSQAIDLLGVTVTCGNAELDKCVSNTLRILEFIGAGDVPVAAGCYRPLARPLVLGTADGPSGLEGSPYPPMATKTVEPLHAVDFIAKTLREHDEPLRIVATGPLCNIGLFILEISRAAVEDQRHHLDGRRLLSQERDHHADGVQRLLRSRGTPHRARLRRQAHRWSAST